MATNYGELQEEVRDYLYGRKDLGARIPQFIAFSEKKIFRQLRCRFNEVMFSGVLGTDSPDGTGFALPTDFLEMKFMLINGKPCTRISDIEYLSKINIDNAGGEPSQFARVLDDIKLWRQADSDYTFEYVYWGTQEGLLVNDADTTTVLNFAPDLYLYGALIEAMPFLVKDDRLATWQAMFSQAMDEVNNQTIEGEYAGSNVSVGSAYSDPVRGTITGRGF